ncbi:MAG: HAD-IIIA family hydrolase [Candidatus Levybacteria bacterium]|nr:HAD-IIIA family hydrolase [Candidatus Levybacteria bacterium]
MSQFISQIYVRINGRGKIVAFIDRDGTIVKEVNYLSKKEQIQILPKVVEGIQLLNKHGAIIIVITNQPVVARGFAEVGDVKDINNLLVELLREKGAIVNAVYFCPHHPYADILKYKMSCLCRKPEIAMFERSADDFHIDLKNAYIIGDTTRDFLAGEKLKIPSICVQTGYRGKDNTYPVAPVHKAKTFLDAVNIIISKL